MAGDGLSGDAVNWAAVGVRISSAANESVNATLEDCGRYLQVTFPSDVKLAFIMTCSDYINACSVRLKSPQHGRKEFIQQRAKICYRFDNTKEINVSNKFLGGFVKLPPNLCIAGHIHSTISIVHCSCYNKRQSGS